MPEHETKQSQIDFADFGDSFPNHHVFATLGKYMAFYKSLSFSVFSFMSLGTRSGWNIDSYFLSSIRDTLDSIKIILARGRINDAYALLRKYYDVAVVNVYTGLYLKNNFSIQNMVVSEIDKWLRGKKPLPEFRKMVKYILKSPNLMEISQLLNQETSYQDLRQRCNDHVHCNAYHNLLLNDSELFLESRLAVVEEFSEDLDRVFILHIAYLFCLNDCYMSSSEYLDHLECGMQPPEGSQYLVAPFVQEIFDSVIKKKRMDIALVIKKRTAMQLE